MPLFFKHISKAVPQPRTLASQSVAKPSTVCRGWGRSAPAHPPPCTLKSLVSADGGGSSSRSSAPSLGRDRARCARRTEEHRVNPFKGTRGRAQVGRAVPPTLCRHLLVGPGGPGWRRHRTASCSSGPRGPSHGRAHGFAAGQEDSLP